MTETAYQRANRLAEEAKARTRAAATDAWRIVDWADMIELLEIETVNRPTEMAAFIALHFAATKRRGLRAEFEPIIYAPPVDGAGQRMKYCGHCGEWVSRRGFSIDSTRRDGLRGYCRTCENELARLRYRRRKANELDEQSAAA